MKRLMAACLAMFCGATSAETAYTVRATELKAKPFSDAATMANLGENSKVDIVARQSSWMQVNADKTTGWVKMLSLRLDAPGAPKKSGDSGVAALFKVATTGNSGSTTTTGVKGLNEENLKNPHPNPQALQALHSYAVSSADAQKFAKAGKLVKQNLDYVDTPATGANK